MLALENAGLLGFFLCTRGKILTKMEGFDPDHWDSTRDLNRDETNPIVQDNKV